MGDWSARHYENVELQLQAAADRAIEHAKVSAGERVLDVCCVVPDRSGGHVEPVGELRP